MPRRIHLADAFTLAEMLASLTVIGILAVLLMPVFKRGVQSVRTVQCTSRLRQWGAATQLYLNDHNKRFPKTAWDASGHYAQYDLIFYLVPNAPANHAKQWEIIRNGYNCTGGGNWKYGFNAYLSEQPALLFTQPSQTILATCSTGGWLDGSAMTGAQNYLTATPKPHAGKINVLSIDGSVRLAAVSTLTYAEVRRDTASYKASDQSTRLLGGDPKYDR